MKSKKILILAFITALAVILCACGGEEKTVIWRDEDGQTELNRVVYRAGEADPDFTAPEKEGKTFVEWNTLLDEGNMKVYQASYSENTPTPEPTEEAKPDTPSYPKTLDNGITVTDATPGIDGQNAENLFDDNNPTFWVVDMDANDRAYVEWFTSEPVEVHGVEITTAEDSSMNPGVWKTLISEDGQNWIVLYGAESVEDNPVKEAYLWRGIPIVFVSRETNEPYTKMARYFRLEVEQTEGNSLLKLAGFGILTKELG